MKYLFDNKFNDIDIAITNNKKDIDLDVINRNQKTYKLLTLLPISQYFLDLSQAINNKNKK